MGGILSCTYMSARALLEETVQSSRQLLWGRSLMGQTLVQEGRDREAAVRVLREGLALDPNQSEARRQLAGCRRRWDPLIENSIVERTLK